MNKFKRLNLVMWMLAFGMCTSLELFAQIYEIPFASKGNNIELAVVNTSNFESSDITVKVTSHPSWIVLNKIEETLLGIPSLEQRISAFSFDALEKAPIGITEKLVFSIIENGSVIEIKEILLKSSAPSTFELFNNYPNPFNPSTTISYQLPDAMEVNVQVFNILGQMVSELVNEQQKPGRYQVRWDASQFASGMYIYQITGKGKEGQQFMAQSKMLLVK